MNGKQAKRLRKASSKMGVPYKTAKARFKKLNHIEKGKLLAHMLQVQ